jgi:hypothetical protein
MIVILTVLVRVPPGSRLWRFSSPLPPEEGPEARTRQRVAPPLAAGVVVVAGFLVSARVIG